MSRLLTILIYLLASSKAWAGDNADSRHEYRAKNGRAQHSEHQKDKRDRRSERDDEDDDDDNDSESEDPKKSAELESEFFGKKRHTYGFELSGFNAVTWMQDGGVGQVGGSAGLVVDHENVYGVFYSRHSKPFSLEIRGVDTPAKLSYIGGEFTSIRGWDFIANSRYSLLAARGTLQVDPIDGAPQTHAVYVLEPRFGFYFNILPFLRFGVGLSYRFVATDAPGVRGNAMSGYTYGIALRGGDL